MPTPPSGFGAKNVYFLPLPNGLEQFVASQIVKRNLMTVVTDPNLADAFFCDIVGKGLQKRLEELFPKSAAEQAKAEAPQETGESSLAMDVKAPESQRFSSFGRGKGTIFLVDRKTSVVLWSAYVRPETASADDLNKAAKTIVDKLEAVMKGEGGSSK
jgi:hypothetical protein